MNIRPATKSDIPSIVELLKLSLGESLLPKSEAYWNWKHLENPFGASPVLLAEENSKLVGVRAFMKWKWLFKGKILQSIRAVDTATHPEYQGRGIFKKLTLALVDSSLAQGEDFIFNTPNSQSKPGYLKMGWVEAGKVPINLSVRRPFRMVWNMAVGGNDNTATKPTASIDFAAKNLGLFLASCADGASGQMTTLVSPEYLYWRYQQVPVVQYLSIFEEVNGVLTGLIIARRKAGKGGNELRVTDIFLSSSSDGRVLFSKLKILESELDIDYTSVSGTLHSHAISMMKKYSVYYKLKLGPMVTIRDLNLASTELTNTFKQWSPTLGDLELF